MSIHPYACALCKEAFSNASGLVNHVQDIHVPIQPSDNENETTNNGYESVVGKSKDDK